jgi:hypothetical protein
MPVARVMVSTKLNGGGAKWCGRSHITLLVHSSLIHSHHFAQVMAQLIAFFVISRYISALIFIWQRSVIEKSE